MNFLTAESERSRSGPSALSAASFSSVDFAIAASAICLRPALLGLLFEPTAESAALGGFPPLAAPRTPPSPLRAPEPDPETDFESGPEGPEPETGEPSRLSRVASAVPAL